jgi:hypothetical protein
MSMSNDEQDSGPIAGPGDAGEVKGDDNGGDRRTFMRRLVTGSLVAGGVGAVLAPARSASAASVLLPNRAISSALSTAKPMVKLTFNRKRPPSLDDLMEVLAEATGRLGCTGCGFDGIDLRLVLDEIMDPEPQPWVAEIQDQVGF